MKVMPRVFNKHWISVNFYQLKINCCKATKLGPKLAGFLLEQTMKIMPRVFNKYWISVNFYQLKKWSKVTKIVPKLVEKLVGENNAASI
jgi:hypothetical protein